MQACLCDGGRDLRRAVRSTCRGRRRRSDGGGHGRRGPTGDEPDWGGGLLLRVIGRGRGRVMVSSLWGRQHAVFPSVEKGLCAQGWKQSVHRVSFACSILSVICSTDVGGQPRTIGQPIAILPLRVLLCSFHTCHLESRSRTRISSFSFFHVSWSHGRRPLDGRFLFPKLVGVKT
jgi:hypothetical protein